VATPAAVPVNVFHSGRFEERRVEIHQVHELLPDEATALPFGDLPGLDACPGHHQRDPDRRLVEVTLVEDAVVAEHVAVIRGDDDQRLRAGVASVEGVDQLADVAVGDVLGLEGTVRALL